jgi:hypothetical protein
MRENRVVPVQDNADEQQANPDEAAAIPSITEPVDDSWWHWFSELFPELADLIEYFSSWENIRLLMIWFLDAAAIDIRITVSLFMCYAMVVR